jgi:signal transduction histidine kinase
MKIDGRYCCIEITDDGCGMDPDFVRERLFRPFDSTKGAEGMGIGAYQIREIVRACGGDVSVRSEVGKGTTMELRLPAVSGESE